MARLFILMMALAAIAGAQALNTDRAASAAPAGPKEITIPAGTSVLLHLKSPINTKSARVGDSVYCETAFPVTQDNMLVIPPHTYVKGQITQVERPGRVKGRAEIQFHFNTLIFPDGYTVQLPGTLQDVPGSNNTTMSDEEGTVKANGEKAKDAGTVATTAGTGAAIGGLATDTIKGAGIGAGIGGAVGLGKVLLTRGQEIRLETGTAVEMVLQRPVAVDPAHAAASHNY
ncbi:MAG TPA: hypothetical protein VEN79_02795 [Terriglobia bacterium]|nr:hypothetical protein [Terriglobia bacterium]